MLVFKNTITYKHVALEHNQPTPITKLVQGLYIQIWSNFCHYSGSCGQNHSIHSIQLFALKTKSPNPNSNPNAPNYTIYPKTWPQPLPKILSQIIFNEPLEVCIPTLPQTNQFGNSPPHHSKIDSHRASRIIFDSMTLS